jgi:hypothetical protein
MMEPSEDVYYLTIEDILQCHAAALGISPEQASDLLRSREGQHFLDGNKRTAWVALRTFLIVNGYDLQATQEERAAWILEFSKGKMPEALADELRARIIWTA